jgi:DNA-binding phage protein
MVLKAAPEMVCEYLKATLEKGDTDLLMVAFGNIAKTRRMTDIAKKTRC